MAKKTQGISTDSRSVIIKSVKTPLAFFVLLVPVVAEWGGFAAYSEPTQRGLVIWFTAIVIVALIAAVCVLAYFGVLSGQSVYYSIIISAPETLPEFDIRQISWKPDECFLNYSGKRKRVTPVRVP